MIAWIRNEVDFGQQVCSWMTRKGMRSENAAQSAGLRLGDGQGPEAHLIQHKSMMYYHAALPLICYWMTYPLTGSAQVLVLAPFVRINLPQVARCMTTPLALYACIDS